MRMQTGFITLVLVVQLLYKVRVNAGLVIFIHMTVLMQRVVHVLYATRTVAYGLW